MPPFPRPLPFELLVEILCAQSAQTLDGTPVSRVEARLLKSLELARMAGLKKITLWLDRQDFAWLCNARGIDRLSSAAAHLKIEDIPVLRAKSGTDSHYLGVSAFGEDVPLPVLSDPSLTRNFQTYVPNSAEKAAMLENLKALGHQNLLDGLDPARVTRQ
ncbi:hypothetical protein [Asticcacaulis sp. W401b]|uniref:hypothetical protein n=1 Tax=Asticcacaulis sp. W401b TaxID=3388666 RepID=UPI003970E458